MSRRLSIAGSLAGSIAASLALALGAAHPASAADNTMPSFGRPVTPADLAGKVAIPPSGAGLPPGQGTAAQGKEVYANTCVACHGEKLQGVAATGGLPLVGGRGTLAAPKPFKTVESYWPYATTLYDYVKRAMPFNSPGSLTDDQVYAVSAYILAEGGIIKASDVMDAASLPKVQMPNAKGFIPDPRPK